MYKQASYSKYQKRAIKFLTDFLGADTPFSYEKTQTNHLKVLIDGVPKPLFTGSTPSDCKSINNFMAEVKREVKASKVDDNLPSTENEAKVLLTSPMKLSQDRLIQHCIKSLRNRLEVMKSQEEENVLAAKSVDIVTNYRNDAIKHSLSLALQARRQGHYIKPKEMKSLESKISAHLNFMMPTLAHYSELLSSKTKYQEKVEAENNNDLPPCVDMIAVERHPDNNIVEPVSVDKPSASIEIKKMDDPQQHKESVALQLMTMASDLRVTLLRNLTKSQSLQLIDDINQAMTINREQDIEAVIAMIKEKDLPLEAIISRIEAG